MATAVVEEFMSLADGVGIIPKKFRNKGYGKLDFKAGEGGIQMAPTPGAKTGRAAAAAPDQRLDAFLAGVAAGADPAKMAEQLIAGGLAAGDKDAAAAAAKGGASS